MKTRLFACLMLLAFVCCVSAKEYFVAPGGNDFNPGTKHSPLGSIQSAAERARPGDIITVRGGVYREQINPPRGGTSDKRRILYRAMPGERVEITGAEIITNWTQAQGDTWTVTLPNSFFGGFNPYADLIHGDWFDPKGREHHTGAVYLNGNWLVEAAKFEEILMPVGTPLPWLKDWDRPERPQLWFARVDASSTTLWAQFPGVNPNEQCVEINVRKTVFYPDRPGCNYITVRGFVLRQAATPWAPPTAEQIGLIGTHWSKGWIIESNIISHSVCSAIALGKYGDKWDNTSANTAEGYVKTIQRALQKGWNAKTIGGHVVRNNIISHCEQTGIVGSLGAAFCTINGNTIHDIHVRHLFSGAEMAGIKFHAAIDTVISSNHIYRTCRGLWLDWMAQGTRVSCNLFHDNAGQDVFVEVDHGPFVMDNNLFLSPVGLLDMSEGGAYAHNLFAGKIVSRSEPSRQTPFHPAHSTSIAGLIEIKGGDDRFYNNVFVAPPGSLANLRQPPKDPEWNGGYGLWIYDFRKQPLQIGGNVFYGGAQPCATENCPVVAQGSALDPKLIQNGNEVFLRLNVGPELGRALTRRVNTSMLGKAMIPQVRYEKATGDLLEIDHDYFGRSRSKTRPTPGPFESLGSGEISLKLK